MENKDSNTRLAIQNENNEWIVPYVIEPSAGVDRGVLAIINEAFTIETLQIIKKNCIEIKKTSFAN